MNPSTNETRELLVATALTYAGTPYHWGGQSRLGVDCSGLVIQALRAIKPGHMDMNAAYMADHYREVGEGEDRYGCAVCMAGNSGKVTHVALIVERDVDWDNEPGCDGCPYQDGYACRCTENNTLWN